MAAKSRDGWNANHVIAKLPDRFRALADEVTWEIEQRRAPDPLVIGNPYSWQGDEPTTCGCGRKLRITKDTILMRRFPVLESVCSACTPKYRLVRAPFRYEGAA